MKPVRLLQIAAITVWLLVLVLTSGSCGENSNVSPVSAGVSDNVSNNIPQINIMQGWSNGESSIYQRLFINYLDTNVYENIFTTGDYKIRDKSNNILLCVGITMNYCLPQAYLLNLKINNLMYALTGTGSCKLYLNYSSYNNIKYQINGN